LFVGFVSDATKDPKSVDFVLSGLERFRALGEAEILQACTGEAKVREAKKLAQAVLMTLI